MKVGDRFISFVELQDAVDKYSSESFVQFCIHTSSKLENRPDFHNTHLSLAPKELVYYFVKYVCVKSGKYISKAKLRQTKTLKQGCEAGFRVKLSKCSKFLEVVAINHNHNHSTTELEFKAMSKQRNKIGDEMEALCKVGMDLKSNRQALIHKIRSETGRMITPQDIHNLINKTKTSTASLTDDLQFLETEFNCQVTKNIDSDNNLLGVFFQDEIMRKSFEKYPEVVCIDGTYCLISSKATTLIFLIIDGNGKSIIVGIALLITESQLMMAVEQFTLLNKNFQFTKIVMSDKCQTERNSISTYFPTAKRIICLFHTMQIFKRTISRANFQSISMDDLTKAYDMIRILV